MLQLNPFAIKKVRKTNIEKSKSVYFVSLFSLPDGCLVVKEVDRYYSCNRKRVGGREGEET